MSQRAHVVPIYRAILLECERRRRALGIGMEVFSELAGLPERYYAKALHADARSGRQAEWQTLQAIIDALYPGGFDLELKPKPGGAAVTVRQFAEKLAHLKAAYERREQRALMRELSRRAVAARRRIPRAVRRRIARRAARARWRRRGSGNPEQMQNPSATPRPCSPR
jgi:hypothetical protein